ncbi:HAD domain-containing protein [Micromonospora zamorensis]|uniref:HAD domain-containing protein n=1 Tax=Micromonospora zamorensis TaxID=709883 RepID=UPI0033D0462D
MSAAEPTPSPAEPIFVDRHDLPYVERPWGPMYLSPCCLAAVTIFVDDDVLYCKKCYQGVDERLAAIPEPREPALPLQQQRRRAGTAAAHRVRPVVAVDVDGVLNPDHPPTARQLGYQRHHYDGPSPTGQHVSGEVWLHPDHSAWLRELSRDADLVWCTSWGAIAATWIAPRLGLPADLPVIDVGDGGVRFGPQLKLAPLYRAVGGRPLAILDDEFGGRDAAEATDRTARGSATLLVPVDSATGLQRGHIDQIIHWLNQLPADGQKAHVPGDTGIGPAAPDGGDTSLAAAQDLSVGDPVLRKSRMLSRQCRTCIFRPGNLMRLSQGRLRELVAEARRGEAFVVCHDTLPYSQNPEAKPAICRGFADRYSTQSLQVIERLFGFVEVDPPGEDASGIDATAPPHDNATGTARPSSAG